VRCLVQGTLVRGIGDETAVGIVRSANLRQWEVGRRGAGRHDHVDQSPLGMQREIRVMTRLELLDTPLRHVDRRDDQAVLAGSQHRLVANNLGNNAPQGLAIVLRTKH